MRIFTLFFTIVSVILSTSCSSDNDDGENGKGTGDSQKTLSVSSTELTFNADGETKTFAITSNTDWQISTFSNDWCTITPSSGSNNATIEVAVRKNEKTSSRSTRITIKSDAGNKFIDVKQDAGIYTPPTRPEPTGHYLPLMTITTRSGQTIIDKVNYIKGNIKIEERDENGNVTETLLDVEMTEDGIRGRGNSTWGMDKKPYRIKLDKSVEILGMPRNKHWTLLANYSDKTLMRNEVAFWMSRKAGYAYTPRQKYVDVKLNGEYLGNYMLCEHIRIDQNRVNISEGASVSGGFLFEIDERRDDISEAYYFDTKGKDEGSHKLIVAVKRPELPDITEAQKEYVKAHFQKIEDALYARNGLTPENDLPKYLDVESFIDYFIISELSKNVDGNLRLSTYMYKKEDDDRLFFGPVWDFDLAFGNADYNNCFTTEGWYGYDTRWYRYFFRTEKYREMLVDRWKELRSTEFTDAKMFAYIDEVAAELEISQQKNFERWKILDKKVWPNYKVPGSYRGEIAYLKEFISKRAAWMDRELQ